MNDILPAESARWEWLEAQVRELMARFAYRNVRTPIVEHTQLFVRGIGEVTDIVEKEMYSFEDKLNGERLTLRPEGTASLVRATIENNLLYDGGKRMWYMGPMFRHERPQRGRYRQFHQIGAEALGFAGPDVDAELIMLAVSLWKQLGLTQWRLEINSLGQPEERQAHRQALIAYLEQHTDVMDEEAKRRMYSNPLRVLDTKNPAMQDHGQRRAAPAGLPGRGLAGPLRRPARPFWTPTACPGPSTRAWCAAWTTTTSAVFEFVTDMLGSQGTICAGGRYDYLIEQVGGKSRARRGLGTGRGACAGAASRSWAPTSPQPASGCLCHRARCRRHARGAASPCCSCAESPGRARADARGWRRGHGQHEVAVQEGRRERARAFALIFGCRRAAAGPGHRQALRCATGAGPMQVQQSLLLLAAGGRLGVCATLQSAGLHPQATGIRPSRPPTIQRCARSARIHPADTFDPWPNHLDLEEQEQLDQIKHFWNTWGTPSPACSWSCSARLCRPGMAGPVLWQRARVQAAALAHDVDRGAGVAKLSAWRAPAQAFADARPTTPAPLQAGPGRACCWPSPLFRRRASSTKAKSPP